uniref:DNA-directed RNA polymerase subunit n=1 Tax=Megaloselaginella exaltata TaxID=3140882 RepID=A0A7U3UCD2_9TRAC|nr:RNA polymerase beta [Selaginella exaltata]
TIRKENYQYVRIGLASPRRIREWSEKMLPTGEIVGRVNRPSTFHHGSDEPERDGTSRERIFGPIRCGIRACGEYKGMAEETGDSRFCKDCGAEFVESRARRYRMGYIESACAVTHVWFLKNVPGHIANILSKPMQELESLAYRDLLLAKPVTGDPTLLGFRRGVSKYDEYGTWDEIIPRLSNCSDYDESIRREITTGGDAIREPSASLDPKAVLGRTYAEWGFWMSNGPMEDPWGDRALRGGKDLLVRRIRLMTNFVRTNTNPEWMVLSSPPVPPPELRPMVPLGGGRTIGSDMNELYRRIIFRNNPPGNPPARRILAPEGVIVRQKKLLQGAVDALLGNGIGGQPMTDTDERPFKSLSDMIQGKGGRFRENLLGKRVDYPGRSVIAAGPYLRLHQCGLPRGIATELFQPVIIRRLLGRKSAPSIKAAKALVRKKKPFVGEVTQEVMRGHTVLPNRAPTSHRLGIQAFEPVLADGCAIRIHPLVCAGPNADFDGDQMAVHVPLPLGAQAEARSLALSHMNLPSPATGDPISSPNQDMLLGLYILTIESYSGIMGNRRRNTPYRQGVESNPISYEQLCHCHLGSPNPCGGGASCGAADWVPELPPNNSLSRNTLWLWQPAGGDLRVMNSITREEPFELQYEPLGTYNQIYEHSLRNGDAGNIHAPSVYVCTTAGRPIFNQRMEPSSKSMYEDNSRR